MSDAGGPGARATDTLRHGWTIAAVDVRRHLRKAVETKTQIVAFLAVVIFFGVGAGYGAYLFGAEIGLGADLPFQWSAVETARGAFAVLWLFISIIVAVRVVGTRGALTNDVGLLSAVPTRDAAVGMLLSEAAFAVSYGVPVLFAAALGYALSTGAWALVLTATLAAAVASVSAVAVAYPVGMGVRHLVTRIEFVVQNRSLLFLLAFVAYIVLITSGALGEVVLLVFEPLQQAPMGWYADVALLGSGEVTADPLRAVGAFLLTATLGAASVVVTTPIADRHWFADKSLLDDSETETGEHTSGDSFRRVEDSLAKAVGRPTAAVTVLAWKRAARAPLKLLYAAYPLLFVVGFISETVQTGQVPAPAAGFALAFVAWAGAVVFTLNPLGDQGAGLPATVLSRVTGWQFVAAQILAGALVAVPLGTAVTAAIAVLAPLSPGMVAAVVLATPVCILLGSGFAVGLGMAFPRYDAVNITSSTKAVVPSVLGFVLFSIYLLLTVVAGLLVFAPAVVPVAASLLSWLLPLGLSVDTAGLTLIARVALAVSAIAPFLSVSYAVRRFDTVTVS